MADQNPIRMELPGYGIRRSWLLPHIVVIKTDGDMSPAAADVWAKATTAAVLSYPSEQKVI